MSKNDGDLHKGHRQRMRDRYLVGGAASFNDHEFIEMMLSYAIPRCNTNELAHKLLNEFGSFSNLVAASPEDIARVEGIGISAAVLVSMLGDVNRRILRENMIMGQVFESSEQIGNFLLPHMSNLKHERVMMLCLDSKMKSVYCSCIFDGEFDHVRINKKELIQKVLRLNCKYVVIAHNHPSGLALPSIADNESTRDIALLLRNVGVSLYDHLVFSNDDFISYKDSVSLKTYLLHGNTYSEVSTRLGDSAAASEDDKVGENG